MTDTERGLMNAILENPSDDHARLVYADWLEENDGDDAQCPAGCFRLDNGIYCVRSPKHAGTMAKTCKTCRGSGRVSNGYGLRAEFIRVQCLIASPEFMYLDDESRQALRQRERELFTVWNVNSWFSGVPKEAIVSFSLDDSGAATVSRGFPSRVRCSFEVWAGGECERCGGDRRVTFPNAERYNTRHGNPFMVNCPVCEGGRPHARSRPAGSQGLAD